MAQFTRISSNKKVINIRGMVETSYIIFFLILFQGYKKMLKKLINKGKCRKLHISCEVKYILSRLEPLKIAMTFFYFASDFCFVKSS